VSPLINVTILNRPSLGYEHHDARLRHLVRSLPDALTSGQEGSSSPAGRLVFRVRACSTASRLQIGLQNRFLDLRFSAGLSSPRLLPLIVRC
jgi:hypothetical protein